jgi:hypothetical protein
MKNQNPEHDSDPELFIEMHLNAHVHVDEFIRLLKEKVHGFEPAMKKKYLHAIIRKVNKIKDAYYSLHTDTNCNVSNYFMECLLRIEILAGLQRLN